jgi:hypothetical protein
MSPGMPGQIGGVGPNSVRRGPALLGPTNADLKISAFLMPRVSQVSHSRHLNIALPSWRLRCRLEADATPQIRTLPNFHFALFGGLPAKGRVE